VQTLNFEYSATKQLGIRAHVGVVGSGDLEILVEPNDDLIAVVRVRTTVDGFDGVWRKVLDTFFTHHRVAGRYELNDFGATPGVVGLRLLQVLSRAGVGRDRNEGAENAE
jgi:malonate decarboxylase delta subunit